MKAQTGENTAFQEVVLCGWQSIVKTRQCAELEMRSDDKLTLQKFTESWGVAVRINSSAELCP